MKIFNLVYKIKKAKTEKSGEVDRLQITSGSRGAHPARAPPPNGREPMIFYAQNAIFSQ